MSDQLSHTLANLPEVCIINNRYSITALIGVGGFSYVYRAMDTNSNKTVVIKECVVDGMQYRTEDHDIFPTEEKYQSILQKVQQNAVEEAKLIQALTEQGVQGIGRYIDSFVQHNTIYIVMEEALGCDLHTWAETYRSQNVPFPAEFLISILSSVLTILNQVHALGYFHCDVKPNNILIDEEGRVTIIDFGAARSTTKQHGEDVAISPGFSPPEFYPGHRGHIGSWTDIYMLAALIYNIITGRVPEAADTRAVRDRNIALSSIPKLLDIYPTALLASVDKAMNLATSDRFVSAEVWLNYYSNAAAAPQLKRGNKAPSVLSLKPQVAMSKAQRQARQKAIEKKNAGFNLLIFGVIIIAAIAAFIAFKK